MSDYNKHNIANIDDHEIDFDNNADDSLLPGHSIEGEVYPTKVNFSRELFSIYEIKRRYTDRQTLELAPDYQRDANIWNKKRKSELIESILMGMPLPVFYFFSDIRGVWQVVDGRQRLSTLFDYLDNKFSLSKDLNILTEISGKKFNELSPFQQGIIEDYSIHINLIRPPTPDRVKFDIFDRVNRGGISLNNQEMRNAIYQGNATRLLNKLAENLDFITVTEGSVSAKRMKDRYIILRFIAFYLLNSSQYKDMLIDLRGNLIEYRSDIDDFLGKVMQFLNAESGEIISQLELVFSKAMSNALDVFGAGCFRVSAYIDKHGKNLPLNMALFESLAFLSTNDLVLKDIQKSKCLIDNLLNDSEFIDYIRNHPVDSSIKVNGRFKKITEVLGRLNSD